MAIVISYRLLPLTFCVVIGITMLCNFHDVSAQCQGIPVPDLIAQCRDFVQLSGPKIDPSPECCWAIKGADVPCLCKYVTKEIEKLVSMEKVVYVCRFCGKNLPAGTQCGSYKVPPPMDGLN